MISPQQIKLSALWCLLVLCMLQLHEAAAASADLRVTVTPRFDARTLAFDALTNTTAAGQRISVTRLDLLLSGIAVRRSDGAWLEQKNWFAYLSGREGRTAFQLSGLPAGRYDRIRFQVGVPAKENHAESASYEPDHPLNPNLNGLHWSWQGGYVFLAIEGDWLRPNGKQGGYSWHVATDRLLMMVDLPVALDLSSGKELRLALNVDQIFSSKHRISVTDESTSTHSREDDPLAGQLRENIEKAFSVESVREPQPILTTTRGGKPVLIASNATPYRFTFSKFFPQPALPLDNPLTEQGVELGRRLFHDPQLSINNRQSCASCHQSTNGFTDAMKFSIGAEGQMGTRNSMPLFNLAWRNTFFWDGRAPSLREQVLEPIENPIEMHETLTNVVSKLSSSAEYRKGFARAFGTPDITADRIARSLEQFLLTQVSHNSKFDRSLAGEAELSAEEKRGFELFHTEFDPRREQFGADCFHCHGGPLFQSQGFANNGLDISFSDLGRSLVTKKDGDKGRFSAPSLRNSALTAPYMHDGRFSTLEEVIEHYASGVKRSASLDPNLAKHPDGGVPLSAEDKRALVSFLKTLTDERFAAVTNSARAASLSAPANRR
jgi:cytochrome c peroxidase